MYSTDRLAKDCRELLAALTTVGARLCCFDFGGTLYDFEIVHINAFLEAMSLSPDSSDGIQVGRVIRGCLKKGDDSVVMAREALRVLAWTSTDDVELATKKRIIVERLIHDAVLEEEICRLIEAVLFIGQVAVVTRGLVKSAHEILLRSLAHGIGEKIRVYGRHDMISRPLKEDLIRIAMLDDDAGTKDSVYIGDADVDEEIAMKIGSTFVRFMPFR